MSQTNDVKQIHIQSRVDSEQNWINNNPELLDREIGYTLDGKYKIGKALEDGTLLRWNELEYVNFGTTNLENGEGENSLQQKNNTAIGTNTFAIGIGTQALAKGYLIKTITTNDDNTTIVNFSDDTDFITDGITNEMRFSAPTTVLGDVSLVEYEILSIPNKNSLLIKGTLSASIVPENIGLIENGLYGNIIFNSEYGDYLTASFTEGYKTIAGGSSHAEGKRTVASGLFAHTEGDNTIAKGNYSHAEGERTRAIGWFSHAEGGGTLAKNIYSHTEGSGTIAEGECQHVQGEYNIPDTTSAFIIGNGTDDDEYDETTGELIQQNRSNAMTIDWDGNAWFAGDVYIGGTGQDSADTFRIKDKFDTLEMVLTTKAYKYHATIPQAETNMWISHTDTDGTTYHTWTCDYYFEEIGTDISDIWLNTLPISNNALFTIDHEYIDGRAFNDYKTEETQYINYILGGISKIENNKLTITIFGDIPTVEIPIVIKEI